MILCVFWVMIRSKIEMHRELASQQTALEIEKGKVASDKAHLDEFKSANTELNRKMNAYTVELETLKSKLNEMTVSVTVLQKEKQELINENKDLSLKVETQRVSSNVGFEIMSLKKYFTSFHNYI